MKVFKKVLALALATVMSAAILTGCGQDSDSRTIIRIGHNQSTNHPTHIALVAFEEWIESKLGDKYDVEVFPSELLGSPERDGAADPDLVQINFCVASNSLLETFSTNYTLFNLPYLFASAEAYHASMDDEAITGPIFESTKDADLKRSLGWTRVPVISTPSAPRSRRLPTSRASRFACSSLRPTCR